MKKLSIILLTLTIMTTTVNAQNRAKDEEGIKAAIAEFTNSWTKGDFSDMKNYMTPDCNWINVVGMHWKNLKEVQFAHQAFVNGMFKGVVPKPLSSTIRFLGDDVAVGYFYTHIGAYYSPDGVDRGNNKRGDNDNLGTFVFVKQKGKWMITSAENVDIVAQAVASNPVLHMGK